MTCGEFLARHSEYLDEELGAEAALDMRLHLAGCARCARYDRVLRRGLKLLRDVQPVRPTRDVLGGIEARLTRRRPFREEAAPRTPIAATIAVAGVVALVAWSALFRLTGVPATAAGAAVKGAAPVADPLPGAAALAGAVPVVTGMDLVGTGGRVRAGAPLPVAGPREVVGFERGAWARPGEPRSAADLLPLRPRWLVPGPYSPLRVLAPEFGQTAQAIPVSDVGSH